MAVVNQTSAALTNALTNTVSEPWQVNGDTVESVGFAPVATTDSIGSTYRLVRVRSSSRLTVLQLVNDALTTSTFNVGLYGINGGAVVSVSLFGAAVSGATAGRTSLENTAITAANLEKRVWQLLGLSQDPNLEYDLTLTTVAAATAGGNIGLKVQAIV